MYGSPYRKSTAIFTNRPELLALARRGNGQHRHEQLRGAWKVKRGDKWVYENKTTTAGAYSKALVEAWTSKIVSLVQGSFFEENGEDNGWFDRQLREASHRRRQDVDAEGVKNTDSFKPIAAEDARSYIKQGVVFGQSTKEEARRLGGGNFKGAYPQASKAEEATSG